MSKTSKILQERANYEIILSQLFVVTNLISKTTVFVIELGRENCTTRRTYNIINIYYMCNIHPTKKIIGTRS